MRDRSKTGAAGAKQRNPRVRDPPPHINNNMFDRDASSRNQGMRCFGCGQTGHSASRCDELEKLVREGVIERNNLGKVQWKDGSRIYIENGETIVEAIRKGAKKTNLIMVAQKESAAEEKYTFLHTERYSSDEDSETQEEGWLNPTPLDVDILEAESYGVQKFSKGSKGVERRPNLHMKPEGSNNGPGRSKLVNVGPNREVVNQNLNRNPTNMRDESSNHALIPTDVHKNVFDAKDDDDLVRMDVDDVGSEDERKKERKPMTRRLDGGQRVSAKVREVIAERVPEKLVEGIMKTPLTITGCIKGFFEAEKYVENGIKTTNSISILCTLKSVTKVKLFQE